MSIAPAAIITEDLCFKSSNYASEKDLVPFIKTLLLGPEESSQLLAAELNQLTILKPHPDASGFDHGFDSPTFIPIIQQHTEDYIEKQGEYK